MSKVAVYLGARDALFSAVETRLLAGGFQLEVPGEPCDVLIDNASRTPAEARAAALAAGRPKHCVFMSTWRVYQSSATLRLRDVDDFDIFGDLATWSSESMVLARSTEREARIVHRGETPLTVLRPAPLLEAPDTPGLDLTAWYVARVLDGGLVILPGRGLPSYRLATVEDVASAIATVALRPESFGATYNVVSSALLSYWGHAAVVRDGLRKPLRFAYVPPWRWRAADLVLPGLADAPATYMSESAALRTLGWKPEEPLQAIMRRAQTLAGQDPEPFRRTIERERDVLRETESSSLLAIGQEPPRPAPSATEQWRLDAWAGNPASLTCRRSGNLRRRIPIPTLQVRRLALLAAEGRFLRGEYPQVGRRAVGHTALLDVVASDTAEFPIGTSVIPMATMPCDMPDCAFCRGGRRGVVGINADGYGVGLCTTPPCHLVSVPADMQEVALLADSLACLSEGLCGERWRADRGPVWIAGRTVEAALASWLAQDLGREVVHVDTRAWPHEEFAVSAMDDRLKEVQSGSRPRPTLAFDFSGADETAWVLSHALARGGHLFVHRRPPGMASGIHWHHVPPAAWNRDVLRSALGRLKQWSSYHDLAARIGPALPLAHFWDAFLPPPFSLPYLEGNAS